MQRDRHCPSLVLLLRPRHPYRSSRLSQTIAQRGHHGEGRQGSIGSTVRRMPRRSSAPTTQPRNPSLGPRKPLVHAISAGSLLATRASRRLGRRGGSHGESKLKESSVPGDRWELTLTAGHTSHVSVATTRTRGVVIPARPPDPYGRFKSSLATRARVTRGDRRGIGCKTRQRASARGCRFRI